MEPTNFPTESRRCTRFQHPMRHTGHTWYCPSCSSPYPKPTKFERNIGHDTYKGCVIRSQPQKVEGETWWNLHHNIFFPTGIVSEKCGERYLSLNDAHIAGFDLAYRFIDERLRMES